MKANWVLLICFVPFCLVLAIAVPLSAQQPAPPIGRPVPPPSPAPKQVTPRPARSLERRCREFLASAEQLRSRFALAADNELTSTGERTRRCVELPEANLRRAAFDAYRLLRDEQEARMMRDSNAFSDHLFEQIIEKDEQIEKQRAEKDEEIEKQRANFAEVARFAAVLYLQSRQYEEERGKLLRSYGELWDRYRATYALAGEVINLAKQALNLSPGLSLPVFVNVSAPQVIRVQAPAVPRSLYCTANTMPPPAAGLPTWTWTDCHW